MSARYIQRRYGDQSESRSRRSSSHGSHLETSSTRSSRSSTPASASSTAQSYSRAWTSSPTPPTRQTTFNSADTYRNYQSSSRATTPSSSYSDALVRNSRQTRLRAFSPPPTVEASAPTMYSENKDYYRGYTKSIYEREPLFTDFVRNVDVNTSDISGLKRDFQSMIQNKWGKKQLNDPGIEHDIASKAHSWGNYLGKGAEPSSITLARKHAERATTPVVHPRIYIYHRSTIGY